MRWLQQLDWRTIGQQMRNFVRGAGDLIDKLGGVKVAMLIVTGITFSPVIAGLLQIGVVVARPVLAFGTTLVAAIGAAGDAMVAFNARTLALPIFGLLARFFALGPPLALGGDTARNEETAAAEKAAREGKLDEWQRQNPTLGERLWRWMLTPPAGTPAPGAGGGAGDAGSAVLFGPQLVPLPDHRPGGTQPLQIFPNVYAPSAAQGAIGQQGSVDVNVHFANAPPGMQADTRTSGNVRAPRPRSAMRSASSVGASPHGRNQSGHDV